MRFSNLQGAASVAKRSIPLQYEPADCFISMLIEILSMHAELRHGRKLPVTFALSMLFLMHVVCDIKLFTDVMVQK